MKRIFCLLLAACLLISLVGCAAAPTPQENGASSTTTNSQWSSNEYQNAGIMAQQIIRCLLEKDQDGLSALFCQPIRITTSYAQNLGKLYAMFPYTSCESYRYDDGLASYSRLKDKEVLRTLQAEIVYIEVTQTDANGNKTSKFYGLEWYWVLTCEENPDLLGIHQLTVRLLNTNESVTLGGLDFWP